LKLHARHSPIVKPNADIGGIVGGLAGVEGTVDDHDVAVDCPVEVSAGALGEEVGEAPVAGRTDQQRSGADGVAVQSYEPADVAMIGQASE